MSRKLEGSIPLGVDITDGWIVRFTAVDPTTGAVNTSVRVANAALLVDNLGGGDLSAGFADIEPLFTPIPANLFAPEGG